MMTPAERDAARKTEQEMDAETLALIDQAFTKACGRSYNEADYPAVNLHRAALDHGQQNGDGSKHPPDSLARIKQDFPSLFGQADAP